MKKLHVVRGMRRSGNHALINWIRGQQNFEFFNNIVPLDEYLEITPRTGPVDSFSKWFNFKLKKERKILVKKKKWGEWWRKFPLVSHDPMISLEDVELDFRPFGKVEYPTVNILLLRQAENLFASRIRKAQTRIDPLKYPQDNGPRQQHILGTWKRHARELLGDTHILPDLVPVYYDRWVMDEGYRRKISYRLGLRFNDKGLEQVARQGGGSSFTGKDQASETVRQDVLNRRDFLNNEELAILEQICSDPEIQELNHRLKTFDFSREIPE